MWTAVLCSLLVAIVTRALWRRWRYDLHKVPAPPGWPVLGHTLDFVSGGATRDLTRWAGHRLKRLNYPKMMRIDIFGNPWLLVTDDEFVKSTMMANKDPFPRSLEGSTAVLQMIGNNPQAKSSGLHPKSTPYVKAVRRVYLTAFQTNNLRVAMPKILGVMKNMVSVIESKRKDGPIDVQTLFVSLTLDAIGSIAFHKNMGGLDGSGELLSLILETGYIAREAISDPLKTIFYKLFPYSKATKHRNSVINKMRNEWALLTDEILAREDPANGEEPIWYGLKHLIDPETKKRADFELLLAEVGTVVITGMDTTGHQLAWILGLLATRPDVIEKMLDELKQHGLYGDTQKELQFEDLSNLTYLNAVVREGMRVVHIFPAGFARTVPKDMSILGYRVPKGTMIMQIGNRAYQIDTDWNDLESFKPERWLSDDAVCRSHNINFSLGPRDCIGQKLAMLEMRVAIITILQKYDISLVGSYADLANNVTTGIVIEAEKGIWVDFSPKKTST